MPTISVALDGARRRDLTLGQGEEVTLSAIVYEHDGDTVPITVTNAAFLMDDGAPGFAYGTPFTVSSDYSGRYWYRLAADVAGARTTLAFGWIFVTGEMGSGWPCDGYWVEP